MSGQTAYNLAPKVGRVGAIAESAEGIHAVSRVANVAIPFGCMSVRDADDVLAKLPTSAAEVLSACKGSGGVAISTHAIISADGANDPTVPTFPIGKEFAQMKKGPVFVLVEENVTQGDQAYVRYANGIADNTLVQKGAFRKSYDGTAQVDTHTPTAVNSTIYAMEILNADGRVMGVAEYLSDASATAAEIVAGLIAAFGGASGVSGVTLSGTVTLIITSSLAGQGFTSRSVGDGVLTKVATTANAASAAPAPGCYYKTTAVAGSLAVLEVNLGGF